MRVLIAILSRLKFHPEALQSHRDGIEGISDLVGNGRRQVPKRRQALPVRHLGLQGFDFHQVAILVMKNRRHSQNPRGKNGQAENDNGAHAVAPGDFHGSERQPYLKESQIGFVQCHRFYHFKISFAPAVDDLTEKLTIDFGSQHQRLFFSLTDPTPVGMGNNIQVAIEKRDELAVRLATEILDLTLHADRFLEVKNIVGVGVNRDDAWETPGAHGDAEGTAFPESFILDAWQWFARRFLCFFCG